jgi:rare lipoprotein A (RlpA)-like double-psi beta-barrel protein
MSEGLAQRQVALAGAALVAIVVAFLVTSFADEPRPSAQEARLPEAVPAPGGGWYQALAAPYRFRRDAPTTACGHRPDASTLGVAHPVLPCGTKIYLRYGDREVLTQVVDRGSGAPGRVFDVTSALADEIGLRGVQTIGWRFAR